MVILETIGLDSEEVASAPRPETACGQIANRKHMRTPSEKVAGCHGIGYTIAAKKSSWLEEEASDRLISQTRRE